MLTQQPPSTLSSPQPHPAPSLPEVRRSERPCLPPRAGTINSAGVERRRAAKRVWLSTRAYASRAAWLQRAVAFTTRRPPSAGGAAGRRPRVHPGGGGGRGRHGRSSSSSASVALRLGPPAACLRMLAAWRIWHGLMDSCLPALHAAIGRLAIRKVGTLGADFGSVSQRSSRGPND
jgi:hypothetical protein